MPSFIYFYFFKNEGFLSIFLKIENYIISLSFFKKN